MATGPNISYAVSNVAKSSANPTTRHWIVVKRIMRYLKGMSDLDISLSPRRIVNVYDCLMQTGEVNLMTESPHLEVFQISGGAISWRSKKQTIVALSTAKAEHVALVSTVQDTLWLTHLLTDLNAAPSIPMVIYEDNQSTTAMTRSPEPTVS